MKCLKALFIASVLLLAPVAAFAQDAGTAPAAAAPAADDSLNQILGFAKSVMSDVQKKDWRMLAATVVMALAWALRKYGSSVPKLGPWMNTDRGGAVLALILGLCAGVGNALGGAGSLGWSTLVNSLLVSVTAAGGFTLMKKIISPSDKPAAPAPAPTAN